MRYPRFIVRGSGKDLLQIHMGEWFRWRHLEVRGMSSNADLRAFLWLIFLRSLIRKVNNRDDDLFPALSPGPELQTVLLVCHFELQCSCQILF